MCMNINNAVFILGAEMLEAEGGTKSGGIESVPILGLLQSQAQEKSGRVVVYGDSNCLDNSHLNKGRHLKI